MLAYGFREDSSILFVIITDFSKFVLVVFASISRDNFLTFYFYLNNLQKLTQGHYNHLATQAQHKINLSMPGGRNVKTVASQVAGAVRPALSSSLQHLHSTKINSTVL